MLLEAKSEGERLGVAKGGVELGLVIVSVTVTDSRCPGWKMSLPFAPSIG